MVSTRDHINLAFYGRPVTAKQLLLEGKFASPVSAASLFLALDDLLVRVGAPPTKRCREHPPLFRSVAHQSPEQFARLPGPW